MLSTRQHGFRERGVVGERLIRRFPVSDAVSEISDRTTDLSEFPDALSLTSTNMIGALFFIEANLGEYAFQVFCLLIRFR